MCLAVLASKPSKPECLSASADKYLRMRLEYLDPDALAWCVRRFAYVPNHDAVAGVAPGPPSRDALRRTFGQHFADSPDKNIVARLPSALLIG